MHAHDARTQNYWFLNFVFLCFAICDLILYWIFQKIEIWHSSWYEVVCKGCTWMIQCYFWMFLSFVIVFLMHQKTVKFAAFARYVKIKDIWFLFIWHMLLSMYPQYIKRRLIYLNFRLFRQSGDSGCISKNWFNQNILLLNYAASSDFKQYVISFFISLIVMEIIIYLYF